MEGGGSLQVQVNGQLKSHAILLLLLLSQRIMSQGSSTAPPSSGDHHGHGSSVVNKEDEAVVVVSCSGKVMLVGGYLVLFQDYSGSILTADSRIHCKSGMRSHLISISSISYRSCIDLISIICRSHFSFCSLFCFPSLFSLCISSAVKFCGPCDVIVVIVVSESEDLLSAV